MVLFVGERYLAVIRRCLLDRHNWNIMIKKQKKKKKKLLSTIIQLFAKSNQTHSERASLASWLAKSMSVAQLLVAPVNLWGSSTGYNLCHFILSHLIIIVSSSWAWGTLGTVRRPIVYKGQVSGYSQMVPTMIPRLYEPNASNLLSCIAAGASSIGHS